MQRSYTSYTLDMLINRYLGMVSRQAFSIISLNVAHRLPRKSLGAKLETEEVRKSK